MYEQGQCIESLPGILYGSSRPLFNDCPKFLPTLSDIEALTSKLVKLLVPIVLHLTFNEFSVHSSFRLVSEIFTLFP